MQNFYVYNREWSALGGQGKNDLVEVSLQNPQGAKKRYRFFLQKEFWLPMQELLFNP